MIGFEYTEDPDQTEAEMAGAPWAGSIVETLEIGETHIMPSEPRRYKTEENGEIVTVIQNHVADPTCFCQPFITLANERIWNHRK